MLDALATCTGLQELRLEVGQCKSYSDETRPGCSEALEDQASVLALVASLTGLRSLELHGGPSFPPDIAHLHASRLSALSALAGLTRLRLDLASCEQADGVLANGPPALLVRHVHSASWPAQRSALLSALRCMPGLQRLEAECMLLGPQHWADLPGLTFLGLLGVLLPPSCYHHPPAAPPPPSGQPGALPLPWFHSAPLPPRLRHLELHALPSPRHLAALRLPPGLRSVTLGECGGRHTFSAFELAWGIDDVILNAGVPHHALHDGDDDDDENDDAIHSDRLKPDAPAVMAEAVRVLASPGVLFRPCEELTTPSELCISQGLGGGIRLLLPPKGEPGSHACWLRHLAALPQDTLHLANMRLGPATLAGMADALPGLKRLQLWWSVRLPAAALCQLALLPALEELHLHLSCLEPCSRKVVSKSLLELFVRAAASTGPQRRGQSAPSGGAPAGPEAAGRSLRVRILSIPSERKAWAGDMAQKVHEALAQRGLPGRIELEL